MKKLSFSKFLRIALLLAIVFFNFGVNGINSVHAACSNNDTFSCPTAIGSLPFTDLNLDTTNYHYEVSAPDGPEPNVGDFAGGCEGKALRKGLATAWYTYNPGGSDVSVFLDTTGSTTSVPDPKNGGFYQYDTVIAVFTGSSVTGLSLVACNDNPDNNTNQAELAFYALAGTTYRIQVSEYNGVLTDSNPDPSYIGGSLDLTASTGYIISGNMGIGGLSGAKVAYPGGAGIANSNGDYILPVPSNFTGTVFPSLLNTVFTPASKNYSGVNSNQTGQNYTARRTFGNFGKATSSFDLSHGWTVSQYVRTVGDVSGDGKADLVGFGLDGVYVAKSTGTSFATVSKWTSAFDQSHGWTVSGTVRTLGDVDGDGKADIVGFGSDGVYVALSTGSGFGAATKWITAFDQSHGWTVTDYVRTVGDVNGDGKADLVGFGLDGVYIALSNGSSFDPATRWTTSFDLSHGWTVASYVRTVGDVDGDGKADIVGFGSDGVYVALSSGSGFGAATKWITAFDQSHGWTVTDYVRTVGDVNGDGKADLVGFGLDGVYIALSSGSAFGGVARWTSSFDLTHGWTVSQYVRTVGDVSGDQLADLVGFGLDGVYIGK